ncbi:MAG: nucleotidyltransferase family protein [Candidatus Methanomethylicaceae archaeon]
MRGFCDSLSPAQRLLCEAIGGAPENRIAAARRLLQEVGDQTAFDLAQANGVAPIVAHALIDALGLNSVSNHWRQAHEANYRRVSSYLDELDHIAAWLAEENIQVVALKNGGIARGIYRCPGCCPMGDLDVLIEKSHFRRSHRILLDKGYRFEFRSPLEKPDLEFAERNGSAEYRKVLPNGETLWLELQWRPVAGRWIRPDQEPLAEELIARSMPIPSTAVRLLAPEDNLIQVALHTAKHSYVRSPGFRLHLDIDRIVRYQTVNWHLFLSCVLALQVKTPVYFSLAIPKALFNTPIPDEVLGRLRPPPWKERLIMRWLERVGLFNPDERKFSNAGFIVFSALLYDDLRGFWRAIFPPAKWMHQRYGFRSKLFLPFYHARRLAELIWQRML